LSYKYIGRNPEVLADTYISAENVRLDSPLLELAPFSFGNAPKFAHAPKYPSE